MGGMQRYNILKTLTLDCFSVGEERILHSGETSPYFLDAPLLFHNSFAIEGLMVQLENLLINVQEISGFISPDFGGTFFAIALQQYLAGSGKFIPVFRLGKEGLLDNLPPPQYTQKKYVIIEDVITTAWSIMPIISHLNTAHFGTILQVISVVNRQHGGGEKFLAGMMIPFSSVFTLEEIIACRKTLGYE